MTRSPQEAPTTLRAQLETAIEKAPMFTDAFDRLADAIAGGEPDGVVLVDNGAVTNATVNIDLDGDNNRETPLSVRLTFADGRNLGTGASVSTGASFESASGNVRVAENEQVIVRQIGGSFFDRQTTDELILFGNAEEGLTVSADRGVITGQIGFEILSELSSPVFGTLIFEPNGDGGFQIRAMADDGSFDFVVR